MADEYELQRPQLSESDYLAGYRAIGAARASQGANLSYRQLRKSAPAESEDVACDGCKVLRRQRAAAAEQVNALTRTIESLEEELLFLRKQLSSQSTVSVSSSGEQLADHPTLVPAASASPATTSTLPSVPASSGVPDVPLPDVLVEGDGQLPTTCLGESRPHGFSNIVCTALLPGPVAAAGEGTLCVLTGGADKRLVLTAFTPQLVADTTSPPLPYTARTLTSLTLSAPVLAVAVRPAPAPSPVPQAQAQAQGLVAASCMDGSVHLIQYSLEGSEGAVLSAVDVLRGHSKYVTRVAWSGDGAWLATGGTDRSVILWGVVEEGGQAEGRRDVQEASSVDDWGPSTLLREPGAVPPATAAGSSTSTTRSAGGAGRWAVRKVQQMHLAKGSVECLVWCCESEGGADGVVGVRVDTLACTVRTAPALYYWRILTGGGTPSSATAVQAYSRVLQEACQAQVLPCLSPSPLPLALLLHRVPVSEDGAQVDISWCTLGQRGLHRGVQGVLRGDSATPLPRLMPHAPPPPMGDMTLTHAATSCTTTLCTGTGGEEGRETEEEVRRVREQLQDRATVQSMGLLVPIHSEPHLEGSPAQAARARAEQVAAASAFVPVGFSLVDLAPLPLMGGGKYLLAAAADNGMVTVHPWGSNTVLRRCVGHRAGGLTDSPTRLAWLPSPALSPSPSPSSSYSSYSTTTSTASYYLAATSSLDNAIVVYSLASGAVACKIGAAYGVQGAHSGVVRDMQPVHGTAGPGPMLVTAGFDKRLLLWGASSGHLQ